MMDFSTPSWKQIGDLQIELDEVHKENALKLKQILDLEDKNDKSLIFIKFLVKEMWDLLTDGDDPDLEKIRKGLIDLGIDPNEVMPV